MRELGHSPIEGQETVENHGDAKPSVTRREFLKYIGALGGVATIEQSWADEKELRRGVTTEADVEVYRSKYSKIDYTKDHIPMTKEIESLVEDIVNFQREILPQKDVAANRVLEAEDSHADLKVIEGKRQALYEKMRASMPSLSPYSPHNFFHALAYELPRKLADYGIFAKPVASPKMDVTHDRFDDEEIFLAFYAISRTESDRITYWGKSYHRDVVHLGGPLEIHGTAAEQKFVIGSGGQTFYENVILYDKQVAEEARGIPINDRERAAINEIKDKSYEESWGAVVTTQDPEAMALAIASAKALGKLLEKKETVQGHESFLKAHETGHLVAWNEESYKEAFRPKAYDKPSEYLVAMNNLAVHEEIDGFLGQFRYGPAPEKSIFEMLMVTQEEPSADFLHSRAYKWLYEKVIEKIMESPQEFGIKIDGSAEYHRAQALLQLPKLLDNLKAFHSMIEEIRQYHLTHYDEDLASEYVNRMLADLRKEKPKGEPEIHPDTVNDWEKIGAVGLVVGAGALLLKRLHDRKLKLSVKKNIGKKRKGE